MNKYKIFHIGILTVTTFIYFYFVISINKCFLTKVCVGYLPPLSVLVVSTIWSIVFLYLLYKALKKLLGGKNE